MYFTVSVWCTQALRQLVLFQTGSHICLSPKKLNRHRLVQAFLLLLLIVFSAVLSLHIYSQLAQVISAYQHSHVREVFSFIEIVHCCPAAFISAVQLEAMLPRKHSFVGTQNGALSQQWPLTAQGCHMGELFPSK